VQHDVPRGGVRAECITAVRIARWGQGVFAAWVG